MTLYARAITLRNCGRFTVIASDFGGDYRTHTHVTSQALYASLTRGATWLAGGTVGDHLIYPLIQIRNDKYAFPADYDLQTLRIWFTPGLFVQTDGEELSDQALDSSFFNVVHECYPTTSKQFKVDKKGHLKGSKRPSRVPTYGKWEGLLPDRRLHTVALACDSAFLGNFVIGQTYLLGKKRTMMQITSLSEISVGEEKHGICQTSLLQLTPDQIMYFRSFDVVAATMRYLVLYGETREASRYTEFAFETESVSLVLPEFYLKDTPLR